ncbi:MAG: DUF1858 domain-containing protein [Bacillota bacterium]|nr:DUF1858 domain-containing protein [Bacillota bacterium]
MADSKQLDLNKSLYELTSIYPELIDILKDLGFSAITSPIVRNTMGRQMTIPKGCEKQKIPLQKVVDRLSEHGFQVLDSKYSFS